MPGPKPSTISPTTTSPSTLHGVVLVASGAIGAGMFSLPIVSAGMWFAWAAVGMCVVWLVNLIANFLLLETNLHYRKGASFDTFVSDLLGPAWNFFNNLSIAFVMYILLYAYFSASGSIVDQSLAALFAIDNPLSRGASSLVFGLIIASIVWLGTSSVSRISLIFLVAMVLAFGFSTTGMLLHIELGKLFIWGADSTSYSPFIWAALPYFVTSFACAGLVPSLVKHYDKDVVKVKASLIYGTLVSLIVYLLWLSGTFSTLDRSGFAPVIELGGNIGDLVAALDENLENPKLGILIGYFSNFAITTSFLSIALGLFDYLADKFNFQDNAAGRFKSAILTFAPAGLMSFFFPNGFILAIGYAGLVVIFSFFIVPVATAYNCRRRFPDSGYRVAGGNITLCMILVFSLAIALFKALSIFGLLPVYP